MTARLKPKPKHGSALPIPAPQFHPLADIFPLMKGDDFKALVRDVRAHGVREPVWMFDGQILDGRNRHLAAQAAGVDYPVREYTGSDPAAFVISLNLKRRHLTASQRALVAAKLATLKRGYHRANSPRGESSQAEAARLFHVGKRSVERGAIVRDKATPELREAVEQGGVPISIAADLATESVERQRKVVAALPRDSDGKLTTDAKKALAPVIKEIRAEQVAQKKALRAAHEARLGSAQLALPDKQYGVIYADPEWRLETYSQGGLTRHAANHYPTSTTEAIAARPVADIAADDCVLFLWATVPMLLDALAVMAAWGFTYKSHWVWVKPHTGTGYWNRNRHELLLVGTRGNIPSPALGEQWSSVIEAPTGRHSEKPIEAYELIEEYFPTLPKIELNARNAREGWDSWGFEAPPDDDGEEKAA